MTARAGGGSPDRVGGGLPTGGQGSKVYVLCAEPKEHKRFRPGARPGGIGFPAGRIGDRGDREIVYVPNVYVPFPAPNFSTLSQKFSLGLLLKLRLKKENKKKKTKPFAR